MAIRVPKLSDSSFRKGIVLDPPDLCHSGPAWEARKACAPYFAAMYGTGDLWCSFDRFNVYQPGQESRSWLHSDQSGLLSGLHCIQVGQACITVGNVLVPDNPTKIQH